MATSTVSKPSGTWSACARPVVRGVAATAAAVVIGGGLADHWHTVMELLAVGFWTNIAGAGLATSLAITLLCRIHKNTTPLSERDGFRREARSAILATALTSLAILVAYATLGEAGTVTRWLASAAMWLSAVGAWLMCAVTLAMAFVPALSG